MGYQPKEVAKMIGVSVATLKVWELQGLVPRAARIGLNHRRIWERNQLKHILEYARGLGYGVPYYPSIEEVTSEQTSQKETASRLSPHR